MLSFSEQLSFEKEEYSLCTIITISNVNLLYIITILKDGLFLPISNYLYDTVFYKIKKNKAKQKTRTLDNLYINIINFFLGSLSYRELVYY